MNQSTRRKTRHLLYFLLTWVVIGAQIALPLGALVAAVQPTPQMVQAVAQQAGVGEWFANTAGELATWVQPLWGQPKPAAAQTVAPGGVTSGLEAWVKADAGTSTTADGATVATWSDQSGNGYNFTQATSGAQPTYYATTASKLLNFNPVLDFDGTGDYLRNTTALMASSSPYTFLTVGVDEDTGTGYRKLFGSEAIVDYFGLYKQGGATGDNGWIPYAIGGQARSSPFIGDRGSMGKGTKYSAAGGANGYWNGTNFTSDSRTDYAQPQIVGFNSLNSATTDPFYTWTDGYKEDPNWSPIVDGLVYRNQLFGQTSIGADVTVELWKGRIPEFMAYSQSLSDSDIAKINTYLAIKYGITLGQGNGHVGKNGNNYNYVATDGTVIWSASTNSTYAYNIAGIGRDDAEALVQKQSQSIQSSFQPVIGVGAIAATNAANSGSFSANKSYLLWGDNGQAATFATVYNPTSFTPAAGYYRMDRVWKVQESGAIGNVAVQAANADHLLVSSDPTFATGVTEIDMSSGNATVDFSSGQYFTFGRELKAPGGVGIGLETWMKADAGISASDGGAVATWTDQSLGGYDFTQATAGSQPTYYSTTTDKLLNFNPVLDFDGSGDYLRNTTALMPSASPYTFLAVGVDEDTGTGYRKLFGSEAIVDYFGLYKQGGATGDNGWIPYAIGGQARSSPFIGDRGSMGKGTKYSASGGANGYWNGTNFTSDSRTDYAQPQIVGFNSLNSATTDPFYTWTDGYKEDPNWSPIVDGLVYRNQLFGQTSIGADVTVELWKGRIPEFMAYSQSLSDSDIAKINTYLAIKYGITLGQGNGHVGKNGNNYNYVATDGTTIWNASANSGYAYNIAGIGRDDAEDLQQKQAKSIQAGFQPVIGIGAIAASNAANTGVFSANKSYLLWGDNGQAASYVASYTPTSYTPAAGYYRMNRVWKVQETGTINNVFVQAANANHLLVSSDPTFASGVTEIALVNGSATVDFTNGQYFTFGRELTGPGGVATDGLIWVRADVGANTTTDGDQILTLPNLFDGGTVTALKTTSVAGVEYAGTVPPNSTYKAVDQNFNPSIAIPSNGGLYQDLSYADLAQIDWSAFAAARVTTMPGWASLFNNTSPSDLGGEFGELILRSNDMWLWTARGGGSSNIVSGALPNGATTADNTNHLLGLTTKYNGNNGAKFYYDGYSGISNASGNQITKWGKRIYLYRDPDGGRGGMVGNLSEFVAYSRELTANEVQRINSYMALKYGKTLYAAASTASVSDYLASDNTTIWNTTTNSGYNNNIAGIGRDDASALTQKQSKSVNSGFQVTIGLGAVAASNAANSHTFAANKSFLLWGDNGQAATFGVSYSPTSFTPAGGYYRMNRAWKVQETGTITNVMVQETGADHLLVSSDPTFATGVTEIDMSSGSATVNFTNGQYFTFGKAQIAPGGVATNLAFWYKPEAGVTLSSDKVSAWVDQANGIEVTPAAANNGPTYYDSGPDLMNFNPVLNFTNATRQDGLRAASGLPAIPNGVSTFSVLLPDDASNRWFLQWGVSGAGYYNNYGHCNANNPGVWTNSHGGCVNNPTTLGPITTPSFLSVRWNSTAGTNQWQLRRNGQLHSGTTTSTALNVPADTALEIGDVNQRTAGNEYIGNISEVIGYTARVSDIDRQKVESYLAIKYGITYMNDANTAASNYLNSAGATVWDATANSAYASNIAGIGRDDASALTQKQSQSVNSGFQPTIGLGTIMATNAANTSTFAANKSFLLWGDNNGAFTLSAAYNGGTNNRLARVWKVQESGTVGAVTVILPRSALPNVGLRSLIVHSSDPNFATVDRTIPLTAQGGNYVATVDFNNGDYFTFSSSSTLPEINVTPTTLDFGTVNTGSTAPAQAVTIQNQGDVSLSISSIALSGADAARFAISSNNCGSSVSAGGSCTVQLTFTPTAAGSRSALLVITSNDSDESTVNVALSGATPSSSGGGTTGTYNLAVTKSASASNATVGTPFTYTITVLNKGTIAASNVVMTDQLPAGVTFGSANATGGGTCTNNSGTVTCTWASLAGGASATVTISVTP